MEFFKQDTAIDFLGKRKIAVIISVALVVLSIALLATRGLSFGIDFTGGTLVEVSYQQPAEIAEVRDALSATEFEDVIVQYFGTANDLLIRLPATEKKAAQVSTEVMQALRLPFSETITSETVTQGAEQQCIASNGSITTCSVQMRRIEFVGPQVGEELTEKGGLAMIYTLIGVLLYVAFRFEWRFALGSVVALVHDVLITLGAFSLFQFEFSLSVLAAVLAVIGYSLNDTIVVFDRIRENFRKLRKGTSVSIMNTSINQTLRRTVLTSVTTLLVVITLMVLGGEVIKGFSIALFIGILVGTYSSIFVASPVVLQLGIKREDLLPPEKEGAEFDAMP